MDYNAIANSEPRHAFADPYDGPGHLVAEDARRRVRSGVNLFQVGPADSAGGYLYKEFTLPDGRHGYGFDAHVVYAAVDHGAHGGRNCLFHYAFNV
jgi:hypothetical protein